MSKLSCLHLEDINQSLDTILIEKTINKFRLFMMKDEAKLSVTLESDRDYLESYHGLHPQFDEVSLRKFLKGGLVNNSDIFWNLVTGLYVDNPSLFNLIDTHGQEEDNEKIKRDFVVDNHLKILLLGRTILQMVSHYGFWINCNDKKLYEEFKVDYDDLLAELGIRYTQFKGGEKKKAFACSGIWPIEVIDRLAMKYDFRMTDQGIGLVRVSDNSEDSLLKKILTFQDIDKLELVDSAVYYSGVMPRAVKIISKNDLTSNKDVKFVSFQVVRTTFATVDMMDNPGVIKHQFFAGDTDKCKLMWTFDSYEDRLQAKYLYTKDEFVGDQRAYEKNEIERLNEYLKRSFNTHTIAVSANIMTDDGYLIAALRGAKSIDGGEYYCSANGQSEFRDSNVEFYRESVFEDLPSMEYESKYRVDLNDELRREVIAELGVTTIDPAFRYHGISYLAVDNRDRIKTGESVKKRRMHFNVLTYNNSSMDFKEIMKSQRHATENFENTSLLGIRTILIRDYWDAVKQLSSLAFATLARYKSSIVLLYLLVSYMMRGSIGGLEFKFALDIFVLVVYVVLFAIDFVRNYDVFKYQKWFLLPLHWAQASCKTGKMDVDKIVRKISNRRVNGIKLAFHGIWVVMYVMYLIHEEDVG